MSKDILILGAGFGGLEAATSLRAQLPPTYRITLVDRSNYFIIGFTKFDVLFGRRSPEQVKSFYRNLAASGVRFLQDEVVQISPSAHRVRLSQHFLHYDYLIVALGAELAPELTPGFIEGGYEFYSLEGAARLHERLMDFSAGTVLLSILGAPYKCPPAPYEAAFQLHDLFLRRGVRDEVAIKMLIPAPVPLPVAPGASEEVYRRFAQRDILLHTQHKVVGLDPAISQAKLAGGSTMDYDLFVGVPLHRPTRAVRESELGEGSWIPVNPYTLETRFANVYAVGDVTTITVDDQPVPKAGAFAEDAARVVVSRIVFQETGRGEAQKYTAAGTCYLEFGDDEVAQISANFLGGETPQARLDQPSPELRAAKERFLQDRIGRWFN